MKHSVFLVDDDPVVLRLLEMTMASAGHYVRQFRSAEACLSALESVEPSLVCLDVHLPGMSGVEALPRIRALRQQVPIILITCESDPKVGVKAMKLGASDYLVKPLDVELFEQAVSQTLRQFEMVLEIRRLRSDAAQARPIGGVIGCSPAMHRTLSQIGLVLHNEVSVYLHGETGTGKDLIARGIHAHGPRASRPFVAVNCGAIPRDLQESQFFGHERGAFTGAVQRQRGFFEQADGGTLFLDEASELTPSAQVKLLRALQDREIRRLGADQVVPIDVRIISASSRDLRDLARTGEFREDLLYRLVVFPIEVPPLRQRCQDTVLLAGHFLGIYSAQMGVPAPEFAPETLDLLCHYSWPGNVRELQNAIQFAILASRGEVIRPEHLPEFIRGGIQVPLSPARDSIDLIDPVSGKLKSLEQIQMEVILRARDLAQGSVTRAAEMLGVGRATLYRRFQRSLPHNHID